MVSTYSKII